MIQDTGRCLGAAAAILAGCFKIHHIILSGRIAAFGEPLLGANSNEMGRRVLPSMAVETTISFAEFEEDIGVLGEAAWPDVANFGPAIENAKYEGKPRGLQKVTRTQ
ncbi:MAG TPA: hypothetical protein VMN57_09295 [Anaerolineales bacterium]|nr:hypothetical protein [Anaerolineales bacterium]